MKRFPVLATLVLVGLVAAYLAARQPRDLRIERVADNLFVILGDDGGNTAVFVRDAGVVLVDTRVAGNGQRLLDLVRTVTGQPVTHILNTHSHFDHVGTNSFFAPSVEVVAHENAAGRMARMEEFADVAARHGLPDRTFKDTMTLFTGSDAIDLHYFGRAHTDGDAFIVFRGAGVLHAGDTFPGRNVVARDGGSEADYASTMSRAAAGIKGVRRVIPGHGRVATWQEFLDNAEALRRQR